MYPAGDSQGVGPGRLLDTDENGRLAIEPGAAVIVRRTHLGGGDITQANEGIAATAQHQVLEVLLLTDIGGGTEVDGDMRPLGLANTGQVVVVAQDLAHLVGRDTKGRHAHGVQPDTHGVGLVTDQLCLGHPGYGLQFWLHHPQQVVGYLRG